MEKLLVLLLFSVLNVSVVIEMLKRKSFTWIGLSFPIFSCAFLFNYFQLYPDKYHVWSVFWGGFVGALFVDFIGRGTLKGMDEKIKQRLLWKIPLVTMLAANALSRAGLIVWPMLLVALVILFPLVKRVGLRSWWFCIVGSIAITGVAFYNVSLMSVFLSLTSYALYRLSLRSQELR